MFGNYDNEKIKDEYLYIVEVSEFNMFLNKKINLRYGYFVKRFVDINHPLTIKAVKKPRITKKVVYKDIVNNLWKTQISDDPDEDNILKKQTANTNFGMLEKSFNKTSKSCIFDSYGVAKYYQSQYGGNINTMTEYEEITSEYLNPVDAGVADVVPEIHVDFKPTGKELYVVTLCDRLL